MYHSFNVCNRQLPVDTVDHILDYLSFGDIQKVCLVSKSFHDLVRDRQQSFENFCEEKSLIVVRGSPSDERKAVLALQYLKPVKDRIILFPDVEAIGHDGLHDFLTWIDEPPICFTFTAIEFRFYSGDVVPPRVIEFLSHRSPYHRPGQGLKKLALFCREGPCLAFPWADITHLRRGINTLALRNIGDRDGALRICRMISRGEKVRS